MLPQRGCLCASVPAVQTLGIMENGFNLCFRRLSLGFFLG